MEHPVCREKLNKENNNIQYKSDHKLNKQHPAPTKTLQILNNEAIKKQSKHLAGRHRYGSFVYKITLSQYVVRAVLLNN